MTSGISAKALVAKVVTAKTQSIGTLEVARVLPTVAQRALGPFVFLDHFGPVMLGPGNEGDVRPHPHIGLSTVTYLLEGENVHRDSLGTEQRILPLDLNVMTAGRGIVHSERRPSALKESGGKIHGIQFWVALPTELEDCEPHFEHHERAALPSFTLTDGSRVRLLLGTWGNIESPAEHPSQPFLADISLSSESAVALPPGVDELGVYVIDGGVDLGGTSVGVHQLAVLEKGEGGLLRSKTASRVLLVGGVSQGPRYLNWNFVSSDPAKLERARAAWRAQEFPKIPGDDLEFIPLPD